ncbi:hypothetical protein [Hippea maritima]|uniref:Uncharacterized protein n=1 Tax=Hippea maritima (strain ATCC 700847 / DSM 10411 / MH2) TaxID=760142 RepID=F2LVZ6_HIPMA|nr:hypothetical protein [Hippea maritima]AEA33930.1 hypothetical protein Hipma_0961 [Hippea maritima DSM 10411]
MRKVSLVLLIFIFFGLNSFAYQNYHVPKTLPEGLKKSTNIPKFGILRFDKLKIATSPSGVWRWQATITNVGTAPIDGRSFTLQGYSQEIGSNAWKPASGSILKTGYIQPHQTVTVTNEWVRCCHTNKLKVVLFGKNNRVIAYKIIPRLSLSYMNTPFNVKITRIEWNNTNKTWRVTLKNPTDYTLYMFVQGYVYSTSGTQKTPAGGTSIMLHPHYTATTNWVHAPQSTQNGAYLEVHEWYHSKCSQDSDVRKCGFEKKYIIQVPNSKNF